jgi:hypothetical protein
VQQAGGEGEVPATCSGGLVQAETLRPLEVEPVEVEPVDDESPNKFSTINELLETAAVDIGVSSEFG